MEQVIRLIETVKTIDASLAATIVVGLGFIVLILVLLK
jgi:hypothetical protein